MNLINIIDLPSLGDERGELIALENNESVPFKIKRVYYINKLFSPKAIRGKHAHKKLEQIIFCVNGSFVLNLDDYEVKNLESS